MLADTLSTGHDVDQVNLDFHKCWHCLQSATSQERMKSLDCSINSHILPTPAHNSLHAGRHATVKVGSLDTAAVLEEEPQTHPQALCGAEHGKSQA
jgi:hypothetical protein